MKILKPTPLKIFIFIIFFLLTLSIEPYDISLRSRGLSEISLLKALIRGINLPKDSYLIIFILLVICYIISCLAVYVFSEKAIKVWKRKPKK